MSRVGKDDPFSRWAKRKEAVARQEAEAEAPKPDAEDLAANARAAEAVDLETLGPDSDLSVFLRRGVPELLKRQALQAVWRSDPVFANLDGMVDYGEDFGRPDLTMKLFKSAWQAGRGYARKAPDPEPLPDAPQEPAAIAEVDQDEPPAPEPEPQAAATATAEDAPAPIAPSQAPDSPAPIEEVLEPLPSVSLRHRLGL